MVYALHCVDSPVIYGWLQYEKEIVNWRHMIMRLTVVLLLGTLCFSSGHEERENDATDNCLLWYYNMPRSIECREGTRFSTGCQVKVPCDVETEVDWYWSPQNMPNTSLLITNSAGSNGALVRAPMPSNAMCSLNGLVLLYTLTLARLNNDHVGYYWCQLRVIGSGTSHVGDLLPSSQCYVSIRNTTAKCDYGGHNNTWMCAQNQSMTTITATTTTASTDGETLHSVRPIPAVTQLSTLNSPQPTVDVNIDKGPSDKNRDPLVQMPVTVIEVVLLVVIMICAAIVALLMGCLIHKHRKGREGTAVVVEVRKQLPSSEGKATTPDAPNPRYTLLNALTRTLSFPQLASESCRHYSKDKLTGEEATYSSPYQHLNLESLDYTSMYSKPHLYTEITVGKSSHPNIAAL